LTPTLPRWYASHVDPSCEAIHGSALSEDTVQGEGGDAES
jgi:hypothetical protein